MHVVGKSMNDIYRQLCGKISVQGQDVAGTKELLNSGFTLLDITENVPTVRTPYSISYMLGELAWYFTGRDDVEFISKFSSFWKRISDDGVTNRSAYGAIVFNRYGFDQVEQVIDTLTRDPSSRRAIINFNVPNPWRFETKDEICTIALVFELRDGKLDCTGIMRSNDIWLGTPYDVVFFTELQKHIANVLGVAYGKYTHFAVSLHAYTRDIDYVRGVWCGDHTAAHVKLDIEKFLTHISEIEHVVMSSNAAREDIVNYCLNKGIMEIKDED